MRSLPLFLTLVPLILVSAPSAAQTAPQSGARSQATASARIISAETIRFGSLPRQTAVRQESNGKSRHIFPLARTLGAVARDDQPHVIVTEFH